MGPPAPVDKIVAKSIVGFQVGAVLGWKWMESPGITFGALMIHDMDKWSCQVQGNQDKLGKIGMGLMLRPGTSWGSPRVSDMWLCEEMLQIQGGTV